MSNEVARRFRAIARHVRRPLFWRSATTPDGWRTLSEANRLEWAYPDLSDAELIRLAYWGASGEALEKGHVQ